MYNVQLQKTKVLRTQRRRQATWTQPLQCILQHHLANTHLSTHMATEHDNNHAAIALRSVIRESRNEKNYAHMNNHSLQNTEEEPIRPRNDPNRTRRTHEVPFIAGCSHTWKNTRFRAPAFPPTEVSCNIRAAVTLRFAASPGQHATLYAHGNKTRRQSCSHYTAICNHAVNQEMHRIAHT